MCVRQVVARFEAERQALALMDHPNIAKVLDDGAAEREATQRILERFGISQAVQIAPAPTSQK
jgi:hypothetical protein